MTTYKLKTPSDRVEAVQFTQALATAAVQWTNFSSSEQATKIQEAKKKKLSDPTPKLPEGVSVLAQGGFMLECGAGRELQRVAIGDYIVTYPDQTRVAIKADDFLAAWEPV